MKSRPGAPSTPARPLQAAVDRPKRIDFCIDYFGTGDARSLGRSLDSCGEALLDEGERARDLSIWPATS